MHEREGFPLSTDKGFTMALGTRFTGEKYYDHELGEYEETWEYYDTETGEVVPDHIAEALPVS